MSQNLDPEAIDKLNESFRELNNSMPSFVLGISQILGVASGSVKASDALKNLSNSAKELTAKQEAEAQTQKKKDAIDENRKNAQIQATAALKQFALGLTSTTDEFSTFGKAVGGAGDAAFTFSKNLGMLGLAFGVLIKATTLAAEAAMKQADNVLKAKDELSKMGVAGGMTAKSLLEMGHAAGYSSEKLGVIVKASKSMGTDIMSLGGNVKQSMKAFGEMTKVGNETYSSFQRLGVSQEELTQNQADYVKLQASSGRMITEQMKRDGSLKAASLEYTKNLLELSAITGMSMDQAKKAKEAAYANFDIMMHTQSLEEERQKLLATGNTADKEKAAQIDKELKANQAMLEAAKATGDAQFLAATQSRIATGAWTDTSTVLLRTLPNFEELQKGLREGTISQGDYVKAIAEGTQRQRQNLKGAAVFDKDMAEKQGLSMAMMQNSAKVLGKDIPGALKEAQKDIKDAAEGTGTGSGTDPAEIARNKLTEFSRTISVGLDELLGKASPFMNGFNAVTTAATLLTAAATAAALYLGKLAVQAKIIDTLAAARNTGGAGGGGGGKGDGGYDKNSGPKDGHYKDEKGRWRDSSGKYSKGPPVEVPSAGKGAGAASKALSVLGKFAAPAAGALAVGSGVMNATMGYNDVEDQVKSGELTEKEGTVKKSEAVGKGAGEAAGGAGGAYAGAIAGAAIGSLVPVVGTVIGGILGAALGGWLGSKGGEVIGEKVGTAAGEAIAKDSDVAKATETAAAKAVDTGTQNKPAVARSVESATKQKIDTINITANTINVQGKTTEPTTNKPVTPVTPVTAKPAEPVAMGNEGRRTSASSTPTAAPVATPTKTTASAAPTAAPFATPTKTTASAAPTAAPVAMGNEGNRGSKPSPQPPEGSGDKTASVKSVDLAKILKFGPNSGSKENFEGLNSTFKDAVIAAATEFNAVTGNMILINSAKRSSEDQKRLYDETVAAGRPGMGPTGKVVGKPGRSLHEKGEAVDIQNYKDPTAIAAFNKQGLTQKVPNDPVHFQASDGAMVSGPTSGYPVEATFHGPEIVAPLDPESILTKLSKTSATEMQKETSTNTISNSTTENIISSNAEMIDLMKMFVEKMDDFIDAQSDSNSIQNELLQYSKV